MTFESSPIFLKAAATEEGVPAFLLDGIGDEHITDWEKLWRPEVDGITREMARLGLPRSNWPQSHHWKWDIIAAQISRLLAFRGFSVVCNGETQGLMRVDLTKSARAAAHAGKPLVYVDYLETAPWNWAELGRQPRFRGVGMALMVAAAALSHEEGYGGRVGLHSLPQSEDFYRRRQMLDLGPDAAVQNLRYFEMSADVARAFLK